MVHWPGMILRIHWTHGGLERFLELLSLAPVSLALFWALLELSPVFLAVLVVLRVLEVLSVAPAPGSSWDPLALGVLEVLPAPV